MGLSHELLRLYPMCCLEISLSDANLRTNLNAYLRSGAPPDIAFCTRSTMPSVHLTMLPRELMLLSARQLSLSNSSLLLCTRSVHTSRAALDQARFKLSAAYSFHGKPGSKPFKPVNEAQDDGFGEDSYMHRPDWIARNAPLLKQGFDAGHPLVKWRDAILERNPWGAGEDWFMLETVDGQPEASTGEIANSVPEQSTAEGLDGGPTRVVMAVADGVGGWTESGVDPSHFSQALMFYASEAVKQGMFEPHIILDKAYARVLSEKAVLAGRFVKRGLSLRYS